MRLEESLTIKEIIKKYYKYNMPFKHIINLGAGNVEALRKRKPWEFENVIRPLQVSGGVVLNVDSKKFPGIDIVQDLSLPNSLDFVEHLKGPKIFILANILEHIPKNAHNAFLNRIHLKMNIKDGLLITVPYDYPYHADPIDTMYRPTPNELKKFLPLNWLNGEIVTAGSYRDEFKSMGIFKKIRKLIKPFWILQKPKKFLECHRLFFLFKPYKVSIVFGIK